MLCILLITYMCVGLTRLWYDNDNGEQEPVQFTDEPLVIHWGEGMSMLKEAGHQVDELADLSSALELTLGELVKQKYKADFYMLDQYPSAIRPFYTMPR